MSKEAIIQRMYPQPNRDAVSFAIRQGVQSHLLDAPFAPNPLIPPEESNGIFYTHFHKDHCPQKGESVNVETFFSPTTLVLLRHIGVDTNQFRRSEPLKSSQWNGVDGLGRIYPIPVSHSSVDAQAFFLALESGGTIFYSGDIRSGYRTDRAIAEVKNLVGSSGASLFIGDATRIGKNHITVAEHVERLKQSLRLAEKNNAGTAVFVKAGDYGNIALWFENRVFENCRVFLHPKLERVLGEKGLNWFPFLYQRYGYRPPDISEMDDLLRRRNKGVVFLYDDC